MDAKNIPDPGKSPGKAQQMDYETLNNRRRKNSDSDTETNPPSKQHRNEEAGRNFIQFQPVGSNNTEPRNQVGMNRDVILIQLSGESLISNFNNPIKLTNAINKSEFHKYIIEDTLRVLGIGKAIRFEIEDLKKIRPLTEIKKTWTMGNNLQTAYIKY